MDTLIVIKHIEKKTIMAQNFKSKDRAIQWWKRLPISDECEIIHLGERKPSGHRYELLCVKCGEAGIMCSKYIMCFSKKEALYLRNKIEEINGHYVTRIKKLY
jgi:hypothetical protein